MKTKITLISAIILCLSTFAKAENTIIVDKPNMIISVVNEENDTIFTAPCCPGKNLGNKTQRGDHKTPEGKFSIMTVEKAAHWVDSKGNVTGDYGPWFMRLKVPGFNSIGIHGTNEPETVGMRASMGCIRLLNDDLTALVRLVGIGTPVIILPD